MFTLIKLRLILVFQCLQFPKEISGCIFQTYLYNQTIYLEMDQKIHKIDKYLLNSFHWVFSHCQDFVWWSRHFIFQCCDCFWQLTLIVMHFHNFTFRYHTSGWHYWRNLPCRQDKKYKDWNLCRGVRPFLPLPEAGVLAIMAYQPL